VARAGSASIAAGLSCTAQPFAVGITEEDERVQIFVSFINPDTVVEVWTSLTSMPVDQFQFGPGQPRYWTRRLRVLQRARRSEVELAATMATYVEAGMHQPPRTTQPATVGN
jgi:hypothetical protein